MRRCRRGLGEAILVVSFALTGPGHATITIPDRTLSNSNLRITLHADDRGPSIVSIGGPKSNDWLSGSLEPLPAQVEIDGAKVELSWHENKDIESHDSHHLVFVYECPSPRLRLSWQWDMRADKGPAEHRIAIENLSGREIWLPMVDSLNLAWRIRKQDGLRELYVEKGADTPSAEGTHLVSVGEGYRWTGKSSTYALPLPGVAREIIPGEIVYHLGTRAGWYAGIEFSGRTRISLERTADSLRTVLGLNPEPGPYRTRLEPGGRFETPTVFLGVFSGGPDGAGNQLRPWVREVLGNPETWKDPHYPLLVNNSWGSGMAVDEQLALKMIGESRELGLEMFHLDAGWFRGVGDWYPDPNKFPHGLAAIADEAHRNGLRFGIWVDWTQAGDSPDHDALNAHDPVVHDWLATDPPPTWKPAGYKGETIDIGVPAARKSAMRETDRIVKDYRLDMLEHDGYLVSDGCTRADHPHAPPVQSTIKIVHDWATDFVFASNSTDVSDHAVRAYYQIYETLRREHPDLLFEICNDGGRMVDFGSAAHGDYFSITDTYDPLSNRRAFFDTSHWLPAAMLESYVEKWPTPRIENFLYMLRSGMMGWTTIMQDTTAWTPEQHEAARRAFDLYKAKLRPLIRDAELFHISGRPDGIHWDGLEYWDPSRGHGVVYTFRGSVEDEPEHLFVLDGLQPSSHYRLHFEDGTSPDTVITGRELMSKGVRVHLANPQSSELIFLEASGLSGQR